MRCHLRSYFRYGHSRARAHPLINRVLDPLLSRLAQEAESKSTVQALNYSSILYLVESLSTLLRFGGKALSKACHTTEVVNSPHPLLACELRDLHRHEAHPLTSQLLTAGRT